MATIREAKRPRKKRITYAMVEAGLNRHRDEGVRYETPIAYIIECKMTTGIADWKIASDLSKDAGVEVATPTVRLWRLKGEGR